MNTMNVTRSVRTLAVAAATALLAACAGPQVDDYARETPKLVLRDYFNGPMTAHGVFTDRSGKVARRFTVACGNALYVTHGPGELDHMVE